MTTAATLLLGLAYAVAGTHPAGGSDGLTIERMSLGLDGAQADGGSLLPATNADGSVVAFKSLATNLVPGDTNEKIDVFLRDRSSGTTERVSVSATAPQPNDPSFPPALDHSGRVVAFGSIASNLVIGDFNSVPDIFVRDRDAGVTEILTLARDGFGGGGAPDQAPSVSADGHLVAFTVQADDLAANDRNQADDVFVHDRSDGTNELISVTSLGLPAGETRSGNGPSAGAAINADGCVVAFYSDASNLVEHDRNEARDVFVRNRCDALAPTERVSVSSGGEEANGPSQVGEVGTGIDADGRFVAFSSNASNLDSGDDNGTTDVFVRDRVAGTTRRVSRPASGESANGPSQFARISGSGRFVVFQSAASNLVDGDTNGRVDIFVVDTADGEVRRLSVSAGGDQGNGDSTSPQISVDGQQVVFQSDASNLVPDDTNDATDIFIAFNPLSPKEAFTPTPTGGTLTPTPTGGTVTATPTAGTPTPPVSPTLPTPGGPTRTQPATLTPTAGEFCNPACVAGQGCRAPVNDEIRDGICRPEQGCLCVVEGVPSVTPTRPTPTVTAGTPTRTPTAHGGNGGGGGGGGCGCRVDPESGGVLFDSPLPALAVPLIFWTLRRRQQSRG